MVKKSSVYPESIDEKSYFSDVSLMNKDMFNAHHSLMSIKHYQDASQKLHDSGIRYYSAELFNYLEECLNKLGEQVKKKPYTISRPVYSENEPTKCVEGMIWISNVEL